MTISELTLVPRDLYYVERALVERQAAMIKQLSAALDRAADALEFYDNKTEAQKARAALKFNPPTEQSSRGTTHGD